jgi:hypothetical protein
MPIPTWRAPGRRRPVHRAPTAALFALIVAACGGTEPLELASSYTLTTVEGDAPPRLIGATIECDIIVNGGRLTVGAFNDFDLGIDVLTDCSRGGSVPSQATFGYTGTVDLDGNRVVFHTANHGGAFTFEGQADGSAHLSVVVPGLVVTVDQVTVEYEAD